jgi:hypothetical protein
MRSARGWFAEDKSSAGSEEKSDIEDTSLGQDDANPHSYRAQSQLLKSQTIVVRVFHVHLARAPRLIHGLHVNRHTLRGILSVQGVYIVHNNVGNASRHTISRERSEMKPHAVARNPRVTRIGHGFDRAMREVQLESKTFAVKPDCGGALGNMQQRYGDLEHNPPPDHQPSCGLHCEARDSKSPQYQNWPFDRFCSSGTSSKILEQIFALESSFLGVQLRPIEAGNKEFR